MRELKAEEIENIALGASLLGAGGGGDPHIGKLMALQAMKKYGPVTLIDPEELDDDAIVIPSAMMGAPSVIVEKIPNGCEYKNCFDAMSRYFGKKVSATMPIEAGGLNSMLPITVAAQMRLPLVDADGMGRAFPELQMVTFHLDGVSASPMAVTDEKGNIEILDTVTNNWAERLARVATVEMGGSVIINIYPMTGKKVKQCGIGGIMSLSEKIGEVLHNPKEKTSVIDELLEITKGFKLFTGKITDVRRETRSGFNYGCAVIEGTDDYSGHTFELEFQNENLAGKLDGTIIVSVPDLICTLDAETAVPFTTEMLKFGRRVVIVGLPCNSRWRTPKGLETVGPRYFHYDIDYVPIEERAKEVRL